MDAINLRTQLASGWRGWRRRRRQAGTGHMQRHTLTRRLRQPCCGVLFPHGSRKTITPSILAQVYKVASFTSYNTSRCRDMLQVARHQRSGFGCFVAGIPRLWVGSRHQSWELAYSAFLQCMNPWKWVHPARRYILVAYHRATPANSMGDGKCKPGGSGHAWKGA